MRTPKPSQSEIEQKARDYLDQLTKPPGSLGRVEDLAVSLCEIQKTLEPKTFPRSVLVFAGDHGICEEGVSAYPQAVTGQMIANMASGGACVSVLSKSHQAVLSVVDVGSIGPHDKLEGVRREIVRPGTRNFAKESAMTMEELEQAMRSGKDAVKQEMDAGVKVICFGEMGIGNSTSASALATQVLGCNAEAVVGPGTGLNAEGVRHKAEVINRAVALHQKNMDSPQSVLACLGGYEIAALTGAMIEAGKNNAVIVMDGLICTAAAVMAVLIEPDVKHSLIASHVSAEPGHGKLLDYLEMKPLLDFGMRLGEASGALMVLPLLDAAACIFNEMATFESARVSQT